MDPNSLCHFLFTLPNTPIPFVMHTAVVRETHPLLTNDLQTRSAVHTYSYVQNPNSVRELSVGGNYLTSSRLTGHRAPTARCTVWSIHGSFWCRSGLHFNSSPQILYDLSQSQLDPYNTSKKTSADIPLRHRTTYEPAWLIDIRGFHTPFFFKINYMNKKY